MTGGFSRQIGAAIAKNRVIFPSTAPESLAMTYFDNIASALAGGQITARRLPTPCRIDDPAGEGAHLYRGLS